jgi:hypothetical protein
MTSDPQCADLHWNTPKKSTYDPLCAPFIVEDSKTPGSLPGARHAYVLVRARRQDKKASAATDMIDRLQPRRPTPA